MARHAKLKPRKTNRPTSWEISIPPHMSATGRRERRYFETQEKAEEEIYSIRNRRMSFGETLEQLTPGRAAEAVKAFELLAGHSATLLDVVTEWLEIHKDRNSSVPFLDLFNEFLAVKHDRNHEYLRELPRSLAGAALDVSERYHAQNPFPDHLQAFCWCPKYDTAVLASGF